MEVAMSIDCDNFFGFPETSRCANCGASRVQVWQIIPEDERAGREFVEVDVSKFVNEFDPRLVAVHCLFLRSKVPYPDKLVDCPFYQMPST